MSKAPMPPVNEQTGTKIQPVAVTIHVQSGQSSQQTWQISSLTESARFKRAARTSALLFGLAVVSAPIPPVHWVLVPGFLIASVVAFFVRMGTRELLSGEVACPKCQKSFELESQPPVWPLDLTCHHCRAQLRATLSSQR